MYFLTILDDHSRVVWVHLMKAKNEAVEAIVKFMNVAHTQYERKVKRIRSDNALEFLDKQCKSYFDSKGIIHETSCIDRPQQNGRVERRHRSLLEMGRALRIQSGLPRQYWPECTLAAVYINNRLPTQVLGNLSPYEEVVYMKLPPGYKGMGHRLTVGETADMVDNPQVCRLVKSLYGLKQAPRQWFAKLSAALKEFGFVQSKSDYSLFTKHEDNSLAIILIYVDDLLVGGTDMKGTDAAKSLLRSHFYMKDFPSKAIEIFFGD